MFMTTLIPILSRISFYNLPLNDKNEIRKALLNKILKYLCGLKF